MTKPTDNNKVQQRRKVAGKNQPPTLNVDAGTLLLVISVIILLPLLLTGFISH